MKTMIGRWLSCLALAIGLATGGLQIGGLQFAQAQELIAPALPAAPGPTGGETESGNRAVSTTPTADEIRPFGANLFDGEGFPVSPSADPNYRIGVGDNIQVQIWGAFEASLTTIVDPQGNIFLPQIGPVPVAGIPAGELDSYVREQVTDVYREGVQTYATLIDYRTIGVFVTGFVRTPGRYAGSPSDSIIDFLIRSGGIVEASGSYREIGIVRDGKRLMTADLYSFLLYGKLPKHVFQEGDTIVVGGQRASVLADGAVRNSFAFEFGGQSLLGSEVIEMARPLPNVSNVLVEGTRNGLHYQEYLTFGEFASRGLTDQDRITFFADTPKDTIVVNVEGMFLGQSRFVVGPNTTLVQFLNYVPVDQSLSDPNSVYLKRPGIAMRQKQTLDESLDRLERTVLSTMGVTESEMEIRSAEAQLILQYIERARGAEPQGVIVVKREDGKVSDLRLEDGDVVVIPSQSELVLIAGEVRIPQTVPFEAGFDVDDYIEQAGGYAERADKSQLIVRHLDGSVEVAKNPTIRPGDELIVPPKVKTKFFQLFLDFLDVIFKAGIIAAIFI